MTDSVVEIETATAVGKPGEFNDLTIAPVQSATISIDALDNARPHCASASLTVKTVSWNDPDAVALRNQQRIDIADRYERVDSEPGTPPSADDITMFCVAYSGSKAVGCGGLRLLDHASAEIKRMFVLREARGTGAAAAVLVYLEQHSKQLGLHRLLLETGDKLFDAIRFYTRSGYTRIPNFGYYQGVDTSICMEKVL